MSQEETIRAFLAFASSKRLELGGDVVYGFAMEYNEWRPLATCDIPNIINDFLATQPISQENHQ